MMLYRVAQMFTLPDKWQLLHCVQHSTVHLFKALKDLPMNDERQDRHPLLITCRWLKHDVNNHLNICICYAQSVKLPISWNGQVYCPFTGSNGQYACLFRELGIRKCAHFMNWANVVNEIYIFVHMCRAPCKMSRWVTQQFSVVISSSSFSPGAELSGKEPPRSWTPFVA